jgi:hypothetical protein
MKKSNVGFFTASHKYVSLELTTFIAATGYILAILLVCMLR